MNLGELITALEQLPQDGVVRHGFGAPASYRGSYDELAFEPEAQVAIKTMLKAAKYAVGQTFEGYKGGEYLMKLHTPVWIADWGQWPGESIGPTLLAYWASDTAP